MAEPTPPLNNDTYSVPSDSDIAQDAGGGEEKPLVFYLMSPLCATSLQRRAADVRRKQLRWAEDSPPGLYWNGDAKPYSPFIMMGYQPSDGMQVVDSARDSASSGSVGLVESDAEDSARSSPSSPTSSVSSDCTAPRSTPPDSPKGVSSEVERRATTSQHGYSKDKMIEVKLHTDLTAHNVERQGYMLGLTIPQFNEHFEGGVADYYFNLRLDTASNITWILGYGYCCAEVSKDATGHPTQISLTDWRCLPRMHYALIPDPVGWEVRSPPQNLVQPFPPHVMYHDRRIALISQLPEPRSFTVNRVYNRNQSRWNELKLSPGYRFAVAYAVDEATACEKTNGSFGLGPMRTQANVPSEGAEKPFASILASLALPSSSSDFINGGYSLIFGLRPPWVDSRVDPSWLSINQFPGQNVQFSQKIPVVAAHNDLLESWSVEMLLMNFYFVNQSGRTLWGTVDLRANPGDDERGTVFVLDTGASTSEFPPAAVDTIRDAFFLADRNKNLEKRFDFAVPEDHYEDDVVIDFVFRGERRTQVTVSGPAMPFIYQKTDPESGALIAHGRGEPYILGANFFQTMFVAMYRPDDDAELPYVRLAPQNQYESAFSILPQKET